MTFHHGVTALEQQSGILPIRNASISTIGLIAYADDADDTTFPLDTPVRVSSIPRILEAAGLQGTLRKSLEAINQITNPTLVVVRVASPATSDVIGTTVSGVRTGMQALLTAKSVLNLKPSILCAPELETPDVVQAFVTICRKLRAYFYFTPRDPNSVMLSTAEQAVTYRRTLASREIHMIYPEWTSGNIFLSPPTTGSGFSSVTLYSNQGSGQADLNPNYGDTVTVTVNGTEFVSEAWSEELFNTEGGADNLVTRVLQDAGLNVTPNITGDITYEWLLTAPNTGSQVVSISTSAPTRIKFRMADEPLTNPVSFTLSNISPTTATYGAGILSAAVVAAAERARIDEQIGWHKSLSNVAVTGPTGISQPLTWDLEDPDTDVGYLNANDITSLIQHNGFRFWGNRNCSDDVRFAFEVYTRTAQFLLDTIIEGVFPFIDQPLTQFLAKDIIDSINAKLRELVTAGRLIGASVWYDSESNNAQTLSQGQFWVAYDYTPVPPLEQLGLKQRITDRYLIDFAQMVAGATTQEG